MRKLIFILSFLFAFVYSNAQVSLGGYIQTFNNSSYPTHLDSLGKGGYMVVADTIGRNNISCLRRKYGMAVYVQENQKLYILKDNACLNNWSELSSVDSTTASNGLTKEGNDIQLGGSLTKNTDINQGSNYFALRDSFGFQRFASSDDVTSIAQKGTGTVYSSVSALDGRARMGATDSDGDKTSQINVYADSIMITPFVDDGKVYMPVKSNADTVGFYPLKMNASTGKIEAYTGGFASNVLANNGLSKSVDTVQLGGSLIKDTYINARKNSFGIDSLYYGSLTSRSDSGSFATIYTAAGELIDRGESAIVRLEANKISPTLKYSILDVESDSIKMVTSIINIEGINTNLDTAGYYPLKWNPYVRRLEAYTGGFGNLGVDTTSLSNRINLKLNISDTAGMLSPYFKAIDTANLRRVKYVGLTMPSAFNVAGSPITDSGTIAVTGAGTASQYVRGDGVLGDFPTATTGGGASVSYYLNGSVNKGTFVGNTYYEMSRTAIIGAGTDFTRTNAQGDGYIAQFITDTITNLLIPAGNWNLEFYFSASSGGGTPSFYVELYKYDGTNFTLIASNSTSPELIAFGTTINPYFSALAVPETILSGTDRLALRIYVNTSGRSITLHTENSHLCQVITTFTTGLTALNGLTKQVQYLAVGTSGTDFNISSATDTHTFNLPTASATNRGALSSADWTTFNGKVSPSDTANKWITNVFRKTASDSVFFVRGGTNNFAFRDSTGGSNIYTANGSLTSERTLTLNSQPLTITGTTSSRFFANGNMGIGTTTDSVYKFTINGNQKINSTTSGAITQNNLSLRIDDSNTTSGGTFALGYNNNYFLMQKTDGSGNAVDFRTTNSSFSSASPNIRISPQQISISSSGRSGPLSGTNHILSVETNTNALDYDGLLLTQGTMGSGTQNQAINWFANNAYYAQIAAQVGSSYTDNRLIFRVGNSSRVMQEVMRMTRNQNVLIGTTTDVASSLLTLESTTRGFLQPRMTTTQMNAISTPATGLSVFNTTDSIEYVRRGSGDGWQPVATGGSGFRLNINGTSLFSDSVIIDRAPNVNNEFKMKSNTIYANFIRFLNRDNTGQGTILATGSGYGFGTFRQNQINLSGSTGGIGLRTNNGADAHITFYAGNAAASSSTAQMQMFASTGNVLLQNGGTYTDAGYRLDVNGTTRIQNKLSVGTPSATSAILEVTSTTQGFMPPRMTTAQRDLISSPAAGLIIYNTSTNKHQGYDGTTWNDFY